MFKPHRTVTALLVIVLILGILAACSGNSGSKNEPSTNGGQTTTPQPSTPEPAPAPEPEPEPEPEPVELTVYSNNADADFEARFAQAAIKKYPHFTFKHRSSGIRNLRDTIEVDGVTPDIGYGANLTDYRLGFLPKNLARDITDLIEAADFDLNRFDPGTIQTIRNLSGGQLYGLPNTSNPIVLFYNKDIFDAFNVPYPTDGMTWDQVYELAQKVTGEVNGTKYVGFGSFHSFLFGMNQQSLPLVDDATGQATVNNEGFKKITENLIRFYQIPGIADGYNPEGNGNDDLVRFYEQKDLAMVVSLLSSVNRPGFETVNWDMVTAPTFPDLPGVGFQDGVNFNFISSTAENPEAAFQALAEYYSEENQIALARLMIVTPLVNEKVRAALGDAEKLKSKNVNAVYGNRFAPTPTPHPVIATNAQGIFATHFSKLITGGYKSVDEMLAAADAAINEAIRSEY
jgi:multiple sugar transport system substrate-binding protein